MDVPASIRQQRDADTRQIVARSSHRFAETISRQVRRQHYHTCTIDSYTGWARGDLAWFYDGALLTS